MLKKLHYTYMVAALILVTGRIFAAASSLGLGVSTIPNPLAPTKSYEVYHMPEGYSVDPLANRWMSAFEGTDSLEIAYADVGLSPLDFVCTIRPNRTGHKIVKEPIARYDLNQDTMSDTFNLNSIIAYCRIEGDKMLLIRHFNANPEKVSVTSLKKTGCRWLLLSASATAAAHKLLEKSTLPTDSAFDAARKIENNGTTCIVLDLESFLKEKGK